MNNIVWVIVAVVVMLLIGGGASVIYSTKNLPSDYMEKISSKFQVTPFDKFQTEIGKVYAQHLKKSEDISGAMLISDGSLALLHRIALARMAEHTIELQTYIYENDDIGRLLMYELKTAADRGVKIRIIVDDLGLDSDNSDLMILGYHPNIDVKVFNPFKYRSRILRYPQMLLHFGRINYRMHNKLFIADNSAVILGGRNVAGNYFDFNNRMNFSDKDVLFVGDIVEESLKSFDKYWDYHMSIPVSVFPGRNKPEKLQELQDIVDEARDNDSDNYFRYNFITDEFIKAYKSKRFKMYWGNGTVIADSPQKAEGENKLSPILTALEYLWAMSQKRIDIASAYMVPGTLGTEDLIMAANHGVEINIVTNSLSSTDAMVAYAGWAKYRDELVENGINIYEFKRMSGKKHKRFGTSGASLHSKVMVFDDQVTWVGSFNLDPRSAAINTEIVVAFYNPEFAKAVRQSIEEDMAPNNSYHLKSHNDKIIWKTVRNGKEEVSDHSPDTTLWQRALMVLMMLLPESMI